MLLVMTGLGFCGSVYEKPRKTGIGSTGVREFGAAPCLSLYITRERRRGGLVSVWAGPVHAMSPAHGFFCPPT